jgi:hypothetical protein
VGKHFIHYVHHPEFLNVSLQCCEQPLASPKEQHQFGTAEVLKRIRNVIQNTSIPTWLGSVPSNFGEASAGTLKADEW